MCSYIYQLLQSILIPTILNLVVVGYGIKLLIIGKPNPSIKINLFLFASAIY
jgi:hypothetical protein